MSDEKDSATAEQEDHQSSTAADVTAIAADLAEAMSEPSERAIAAAELEQANVARQLHTPEGTPDSGGHARNVPVDADGRAFDPRLHLTDEHGKPKLTKAGKLRKKRQPKGSKVADVNREREQAAKRIAARQSGKAAANAMLMFGVAIGGEEWHPRVEKSIGLDEREMLETGFADYFEAKEMEDIPPGVALAICVSAYSLPRLTMPNTQSRLSKAKAWTAAKWVSLRERRKAKSKKGDKRASQPDTRDH